MIVVCDTFDHGDFPVYVKQGQDAQEERSRLNSPENMTRVMEVYNLAMSLEDQLSQDRAFNF